MMKDIDFRPIVIPKATYDLLLKEDDPIGLIGLYNFYYYTAVWQKTNRPKATVDFAAKGLKCGKDKIRKLSMILSRLGLIERAADKNENGQITGHFVRVNFYTNHPTTVMENQTVDNSYINAYKDNNKRRVTAKGSDNSNKIINGLLYKEEIPMEEICAKKLESIIQIKHKVFRTINIKNWTKEFVKLHHQGISHSRMKKVLDWYIANFGKKYVHQAYSAKSFCDKFIAIEQAAINSGELIIISSKIKKIARQSSLWGNVDETHLLQSLQTTYENYQRYYRAHKQVKALVNKSDESLNHFVNYLHSYVSEPTVYMDNFCTAIYAKVHNWTDWNRSLNAYIFSLDNDDFIRRIMSYNKEWDGENKSACEYLKLVKEFYENQKV